MARRVTFILGSVLTTALLLLPARPAAASGCYWGCGSWATPCCPTPRPSLPIGHPCYGYNHTVWQLWPAECCGPQRAVLAPPTTAPESPAVPYQSIRDRLSAPRDADTPVGPGGFIPATCAVSRPAPAPAGELATVTGALPAPPAAAGDAGRPASPGSPYNLKRR